MERRRISIDEENAWDNLVLVPVQTVEKNKRDGEVVLASEDALTAGKMVMKCLHDASAAVLSVDAENTAFVRSSAIEISENEQEMLEELGYVVWFAWTNIQCLSSMACICELLDRKMNRKPGTYMGLLNDLKDRGLRVVFCVCE